MRQIKFTGEVSELKEDELPEEAPIRIAVGQVPLVSISATPQQLKELALGFLITEGLLVERSEIQGIACDEAKGEVHIVTEEGGAILGRLVEGGPVTLTSGCGRGLTFSKFRDLKRVNSNAKFPSGAIADLMSGMLKAASLYRRTGGIHCSALSDGETILSLAEDIGRHNTIDKLVGDCFLRGIETKGRLLLTTGRISGEMVAKAVAAEIPVMASLTSPTSLAVRLAEEAGVAVIGYLRKGRMTLYTCPERVQTVSPFSKGR